MTNDYPVFPSRAINAILFSAMSVGQAMSFAPDYGKAKTAAARILDILDRVPSIDSWSDKGEKPVSFSKI